MSIEPAPTAVSASGVHPLEDLLGKVLLPNAQGPPQETTKLLAKTQILALYFSASWCPPCRSFSPLLKDFYRHARAVAGLENEFEIIYVSSDQSASEFATYYGSMPWLALPYSAAAVKNSLSTRCQIYGIPSLVIVDGQTGQFITQQGRDHVMRSLRGSQGVAAEAVTQVLDQWKSTPRVSIEEGVRAAKSFSLTKLFMNIFRNPLLLIIILYLVKSLVNHFSDARSS